MLLGAIALVICAVDIELMLIPRAFTIIAAVIALIGGALMPERFGLLFTWKEGLAYSAFGLAIGWAALWLVVLLGKVMFGKRNFSFENTTPWELREPEEEDDEQEGKRQEEGRLRQEYEGRALEQSQRKVLIAGIDVVFFHFT
jgi:prepilin signal peptidase PulO-like enzyme (type II secretory pathway)